MKKTIFVDVDDTLVRSFGSKRIPMQSVIDSVVRLHKEGYSIFLWSSGGDEYCKSTAIELEISHCIDGYLTKPTIYIDDQKVEEWRFCKHFYPGQVSDINTSN